MPEGRHTRPHRRHRELAKLEGDATPLAVRIASVARDADLATALHADPHEWMSERRGRAYDPAVVDAFERVGPDVLSALDGGDEWETALAREPEPVTTVRAAGCRSCRIRRLRGPQVALDPRPFALGCLARRGGGQPCRTRRRRVQRPAASGFVHDLGRVAIENGIWDKPGPLTTSEWEQVRLHPYYTERIPARCRPLSSLVQPASSHHERLDGSGYHRSLPDQALSRGDRILAAADVYTALTAERPHRPAFAEDEAARTLEAEAKVKLDADAVACVLAAAGQRAAPSPARWPADLTDREVEVLRLIARGRSNRKVAERLFISPKTVGRHVENLYAKIGVSSRAAAALFAMEHRLLD